MPTLTITLPEKKMQQVKRQARASGFELPDEWIITMIEKEVETSKKESITTDDILRWSKEAKKMKSQGRLPILRSLRELYSTET